MTYKATHNTRREDARNCALSFCVYTVREKETTNKAGKERQDKRTSKRQPEQSRQGEGQKAGEEMKRKAKKRKNKKNGGKHATSPKTA